MKLISKLSIVAFLCAVSPEANAAPGQAIPIGGGIPTYHIFTPTIGIIPTVGPLAQTIRVDDIEKFSGIIVYIRQNQNSVTPNLRAAIYPISTDITGPRVGGLGGPLIAQTNEVKVPAGIPRDFTPLFLPFTSKPRLPYHGVYFLVIQASRSTTGLFFEFVQPGILVSAPNGNQTVVFQNESSGWGHTGDPNASGAGSLCSPTGTYGPFPETPPIFEACGSGGFYMILVK